jgi:hypothetical protein
MGFIADKLPGRQNLGVGDWGLLVFWKYGRCVGIAPLQTMPSSTGALIVRNAQEPREDRMRDPAASHQ